MVLTLQISISEPEEGLSRMLYRLINVFILSYILFLLFLQDQFRSVRILRRVIRSSITLFLLLSIKFISDQVNKEIRCKNTKHVYTFRDTIRNTYVVFYTFRCRDRRTSY